MTSPSRTRIPRAVVATVAAIAVTYALLVAITWTRVLVDSAQPSHSLGTTAAGRLVHGHILPPSGPGYTTYSYLGAALGRQYVHGAVRDTMRAAFASLAQQDASRTFVVGECGWRTGGPFPPHHTHENGLSVDVFVPVRDENGTPTHAPTWPWNRFGYGVEFDRDARAGSLTIDFEAIAALLVAVHDEAPRHGLYLQRVILAPEYAPRLFATPSARALPALHGLLMQRPAWVRHDEHVHLDFAER